MKRLSALCLVVLVALAGCTGGGGGGTPTETLEPSSTPTTTDDPFDGNAPPGISIDGIDTDTLLAAHDSELANRSYTLAVEQTRDGNSISIETRASAGTIPALIDVTGPNADQSTYVTENGSYELRRGGGERIVRQVQANASTVPTGAEYVRQALVDANFSHHRTIEQDGQTLYVLRAGLGDLNRQFDGARATWFEGVLHVSESGVVHSLSYDLTVESGDTESTVAIEMNLENVSSTTVPEPDWIDEAGDSNTTSRTLSLGSLDTTMTIAGATESVTTASISNASSGYYNLSVVEDARVSPLVTLSAQDPVSVTDVRMNYDPAAIPGGNESELFVFVYVPEHQTFVQMETSFDPDNQTVRATRIDPDVSIGGETPALDDLSGEYTFVVMHGQTYYEGLQEQSSG